MGFNMGLKVLFTKRESLSRDNPFSLCQRRKHHPPKEAQESRAIANRAILECATSANPPPTPREPKVVFPDKFDGSRRHLRGFLNQLELIFRIQPLTYSSEQLRIATVGTLLSGRALIWYIPMVEYPAGHSYILSSWEGFKKDMINTFGIADQTQESISKIRVLVKDALVHFEQPTSLSEAMTLAIKIDNRIQERRREQTQSARPLSQRSSNYVPCPRRAPYQPREPNYQQQQQQQHQLQHQHQLRPEYQTNSSTPPAARQPDYMDVDLVRRGPLSSAERQHRMSQRLCLVCGQAGHIKATCPKSNSKFGTSKSVRAIQTSDNDDETSGNDQGCY
ncbi:hypothetical protein BASA60_011036 [Batrachochytrium salamandrivorans]|nr:hypothetical protein BASA60_011036 [Batrachochytrium salamandrivorans]